MHPPLLPGEIVRIRDARWTVARQDAGDTATVLEVRGCDRGNRGVRARFLLPFEPIERLPATGRPRVVSPAHWRKAARASLAAASRACDALDAAIPARLDVLPFQLEPALAVVRGLGSRLLIADEVGLGKTVQAGLVVAEVLRRRPADARALVVCPAGLREQWQAELRERFDLHATILDSAALAAGASPDGANPWAACPAVITSIDYVKRPEVMRALEALVWDVAVFDEAHALAGRSDRHAAASALADRSRTVVLLTATPHSGDEDAFARLAAIGSLGRFPLLVFRRTREAAGASRPRRTHWLAVRPAPAESRVHDALMAYVRRVWSRPPAESPGARLAMTVLVRRACSSAAALARSVARRLLLLEEPGGLEQMALPFLQAGDEDAEPAAELGAPGLRDRRDERRQLETLLLLAEEAARDESKVRVVRRLLRRVREPAIVFTEYRDTLAELADALAGRRPVVLHGGLTPGERRDVVRQFNTGEADLLLATDAASEGLNLHQRCRLVVNLELPWSPLRLEQRVGRVDRIGQRRRVHAVHLVAAGTSEEATVAVLVRRMAKAGRALAAFDVSADGTRVLEAALEGSDPAARTGACSTRLPDGVEAPDLRVRAAQEAADITRWRSFDARWIDSAPGRPIVTIARRGARPAAGVWAYRLAFTDGRQRLVWDTLAGIAAAPLRLPGGSAADVRAWFEIAWRSLAPFVESDERHAVARVRRSLARPVRLALERERAIADALAARRARMAATLVQPGLFDRRGERAAGAQAAVVDESLARCASRLEALLAAHELHASSELLFAAVIA